MARIAEKERQDAKLLEKKRKKELKREEKARKEEERLKLEAEELAKQEAKVAEELSIKLALDRAELERAEILAREAQKAAEQKIILEQAAYKNKEAEKKEREAAKEVQKRDRELAKEAEKRERDAAKLAEKVHSRTLADEHSKKLKVRLETRATREQAQNARIKLKEKKATKVSEAMRSNVIPSSTPASLGLTETSLHEAPHFSAQTQPFARGFQNTPPQNMTPSVMQFFHNTNQSDQHISVQTSAPNSGYPQTGVSKLGVSLQSTLPPSLGNLWKDNSIPSQNADPIIPQQNHSPWASASFTRPPPLSVGRDTSTLYVDEDSVFNKIQAEIRRNETEEVTSQPWAGGPPQRLSRTGPPGFSNFGFPVEDLSVKNDVWKTGSGGRYNFK